MKFCYYIYKISIAYIKFATIFLYFLYKVTNSVKFLQVQNYILEGKNGRIL